MKINTNPKEKVGYEPDIIGSKKASKEVVGVVGFALGNLIWRIFKGDFKLPGYSEREIKKYKGTRYFVLGGSIGTNGYTKVLLPILAQKQIKKLAGAKTDTPEILNTTMNSANAGALGTFHSFSDKARIEIAVNAKKAYKENKIPILALIDIGGTKINLVLACLDQEGKLNNKILQSHCFPTRKCDTPEEFYRQLILYIRPVLDTFKTGVYQILPQLAIGQPGRILDPKGEIDDGATDLGTSDKIFHQCNPSRLCQMILRDNGYQMDVFVCNDGIAQFNGLLTEIKITNPELWAKICREEETKIMYLGIGTGLGSGYCLVSKGGAYKIGNFREAYKIKAVNGWEKIEYGLGNAGKYSENLQLPPAGFSYGDIISSKFFRRYMHLIEYDNLKNRKPAVFIPYTGLVNVPKEPLAAFLADVKNVNSPLNAATINKILECEIISSKAEETVDINKAEITSNLKKILETYSDEISGTLVGNIKKSQYVDVVAKVVLTKKTGNTVFFVGIGKSHSIADNLSERYRNLGINSICLELTGANSENLTNLKEGDLIFMISNSGKAWELLNLIDCIKRKGCYTVAITGDPESRLACDCDYMINSRVKDVTDDIIRLPEAPTTTTTAALAVGTAIGVVSSYYFDYSKDQFYLDHPNLIYDHKIKFDGAIADPRFSINVKIEDIFKRFAKTISGLDKNSFYEQVISLLKKILVSHYNKRTVFITGAGSSLHVAEKMSATMTSIGIDATAINSAQLPHGDFAHIVQGDLLIIISFSGETNHLKYIHDLAKDKGVDVTVITANENSTLARAVSPFYVIADSIVDDEKLVPIPDQKLFSSFLDLAVGDAIAVLLAWLIKTTHFQFATSGHRGGAIARTENSYQKYLSGISASDLSALKIPVAELVGANETQNYFVDILKKNIKSIYGGEIPEKYTDKKLAETINCELTAYADRLNKRKQEIMIFGMGSIGLAYIGRILAAAKRQMVFVESDKSKLSFWQGRKEVKLSSSRQENISVPIKKTIDSADLEKIAANALNIDCVFIAIRLNNIEQLIDTILFVVLRRYAYGIREAINFVFDENFQVYDNSLDLLQYEIYRKIDNPNVKSYFDEFVGLVPSINEAIVPEVQIGEPGPIKIEKELPPLYVNETKWKKKKDGVLPELSQRIVFEKNFVAIHMRKLWMHNMAHSLIGYLGHARGYKTIHESVADKKIEQKVRSAMESIGDVLYRRWDYSGTEFPEAGSYIDWCLKKYKNKYIADRVERICRDPERKLRENDRLIGPSNYIWRYDKTIARDILMGVIAAIKYDPKKYKQLRNEVVKRTKIDHKELTRATEEYEKFLEK